MNEPRPTVAERRALRAEIESLRGEIASLRQQRARGDGAVLATAFPKVPVRSSGEYVDLNYSSPANGTYRQLSDARLYRVDDNELVVQLECEEEYSFDAKKLLECVQRGLELEIADEIPER